MVWQREGRLLQEQHRADISDLRRRGTLPFGGGESCHASLPRHQEPLVQRWQQAHCCYSVPLVPQQQRYPLPSRRHQTYSGQHPRCPDANDCREPHRGKGCDGEGCGESD